MHKVSATPLLSMKGITKEFPGVKALQNVDFSLEAGEIHALLGENGAGKSTLMKVLSGVYLKDAGEVHIEGREVEIDSPRKATACGVSIIDKIYRFSRSNPWIDEWFDECMLVYDDETYDNPAIKELYDSIPFL